MKKYVKLITLLVLLNNCTPRGDGSYSRETLGTVTGGLAGGIIGNQVGKGTGKDLATFTGIFWGGLMGKDWGKATDRYQLQNKTRNNNGVFEYLPDHTYKTWINPNTGQSESIKPLKTFTQPNTNTPCRLFQATRNNTYSALGMVCLDENGQWRLVE